VISILFNACSRDKSLMIYVQACEITERDLQAGMKLAHSEAIKCIDPQIRLAKRAGKEKKEYKISLISDTSFDKIRTLSEAPIEEVLTDSSYGKVIIFYISSSIANTKKNGPQGQEYIISPDSAHYEQKI